MSAATTAELTFAEAVDFASTDSAEVYVISDSDDTVIAGPIHTSSTGAIRSAGRAVANGGDPIALPPAALGQLSASNGASPAPPTPSSAGTSTTSRSPPNRMARVPHRGVTGTGIFPYAAAFNYFGRECPPDQAAAARDSLAAILRGPADTLHAPASATRALARHGMVRHPLGFRTRISPASFGRRSVDSIFDGPDSIPAG